MLWQHPRVTYLQFDYYQPTHPADRGVTWLGSPAKRMLRLGHGTYWECAASIMSRGELWPSNSDTTYGVREYHKAEGVYLTEIFEAYGEHYAWPCNVFGNKCFYGIFFNVIANKKHLTQERPDLA